MATPGAPPPRMVHTGPDEVLRRLDLAVTHRIDGLLHGEYQGLHPWRRRPPDRLERDGPHHGSLRP